MRRVALLLVLAAVVLAGCGESDNAKDFTGTKQDVAHAIDDIANHARKLQTGAICDDFLTADLRARITTAGRRSGRDCAAQLKRSLRDADAFDLRIKEIALGIGSKTATVLVTTKTTADPDPVNMLKLIRAPAGRGSERGWRLDSLP